MLVRSQPWPPNDIIQGTFESPQLINPTDFKLYDEAKNKLLASNLFDQKNSVFEETSAYVIFLTGDLLNGHVVLLDKKTKLVDYLVKYNTANNPLIGKSITQVKLWRNMASPWVNGLTSTIFFDLLLQMQPTIVSDDQQTEKGREFWIRQMSKASIIGLAVGLADFNTSSISWCKETADFRTWIETTNAWGNQPHFMGLRFIISRH